MNLINRFIKINFSSLKTRDIISQLPLKAFSQTILIVQLKMVSYQIYKRYLQNLQMAKRGGPLKKEIMIFEKKKISK